MIGENKSIELLESLGISVKTPDGKLKSIYDILNELSDVWEGLDCDKKDGFVIGVDLARDKDYSVQVYWTRDENDKLVVKEVVEYR